ncbi:hypothetical protein CA54_02770 [Symmachiella macrocystis]|uniref:Phosphate-specific transport system accessory protein PhoU n=1 Tax=Symmachiella macrocystis TaxID=2527985 RepID=A0A5C6BHL9_9PLAN|nr:phosphate signaling complex protein PhoU [Symmachiella macrocystis]TWU11470.1 hypothetical protein CA54_02770 [Symmachiella macrocystis]
MSRHLTRDLETLHRNMLLMCGMAEELVHKSLAALQEPDSAVCHDLVTQDDAIDDLDVRLEEDCLKILALYQPVADDLRRITTVLKITGELERVADLGVNIAERAASLASGPVVTIPETLERMAGEALSMLHDSIDALVQLDSHLARRVCTRDETVDEYNRNIIQELTETMKRTPDLIEPMMHLFSVSRHVERVADHATNIAEDVIYLVEGEIVRHRPEIGESPDSDDA